MQYLPSERYALLQHQLELERTCREVIFVTKYLTNAIATDEFLDKIRQEKLTPYLIDAVEEVHELMRKRRDNLIKRITRRDLVVKAVFSLESIGEHLPLDAIDRQRFSYAKQLSVQHPKNCRLYIVAEKTIQEHFEMGVAMQLFDERVTVIQAVQSNLLSSNSQEGADNTLYTIDEYNSVSPHVPTQLITKIIADTTPQLAIEMIESLLEN